MRGRSARVRAGGARTAQARRGLPPNLPLQGRAPEGCAGCAGVPPAYAPEARAPRKGRVPVLYDPPALCFHTGSRGNLGVLLPETGDGTPGLPQKFPPVRFLQLLAPTQGERGVWAS